jgi:hypothetical protein
MLWCGTEFVGVCGHGLSSLTLPPGSISFVLGLLLLALRLLT